MKITLKRKTSPSDKDGLIVMVEHPDDQQREDKKVPGKYAKLTKKIEVGQTIDLCTTFEEQGAVLSADKARMLGYHIMTTYPGMFVEGEAPAEPTPAKKVYADKSLAAEKPAAPAPAAAAEKPAAPAAPAAAPPKG